MEMDDTPRDPVPSLGDPLLDAVLDAAASLIVVGDTEGELLCWNRACEVLSGYTAEEIRRSPEILDRLVVEEDRERAESVVEALARGESPVLMETRWRTRDGDVRLISWSCTGLTAPDGSITHVVATGIDVTERRRLERRLRHLADHDDLTGLINRRRFQDELRRHLAEGRRYGLTGALLVLDLDGFKEVNDNHGHSAGDRVLCGVADALRSRLRTTDIVARLGGDEFAVLLPRETAQEAELVCRSLEQAIPAEVSVPEDGRIEVSVGYATFANGVESVDVVLAAADASMYAVKHGRPRRAHRADASAHRRAPRADASG
jgi:diguanylate cyclase (GGDEF)-like protein/PAS domain S-box-containing protein